MKGLTARLLIFNLLLAVFPVGAVLFLGTYESQLLESQERAMVQQGRLLASALTGHEIQKEAEAILGRLGGRTDARLRVVDGSGRLLADSARPITAPDEPEEEPAAISSIRIPDRDGESEDGDAENADASYPEENVIYRIGALPARTVRRVVGFIRPPVAPAVDAEFYSGKDILDGPEINAALRGRYGAATRISRGQKSVTLYSAIPVFEGADVVGAVLVSRSTFAILSDLYQLRLDIARIFLLCIGLAVVLSLLLARTVTVPVGRLRDEAESIMDERGRLQGRFEPQSGQDEVADLSRALYRLSSRLQERTDHMEDFMADLVHEMKNPVAGILSAAELAERTADAETRRFIDVVGREARRIQHLLDDLRELISVDVRLDTGRKSEAEVSSILAALAADYPEHRREGVELSFTDRTDGTIRLDADPDRLAQAVLNLMHNAISFSPEDSVVELVLEQRNGTAVIEVKDEGPGFAPEDAERIFERWYTDRTPEEAASHTGLGLAIVRGIAEGYGGRVAARPRDGGGAVFQLEFPIQ